MTKITDNKGNSIEVRDLSGPNFKPGSKLIEMRSEFGIGELRLDAESAREIGLALMPHPGDPE